MTSVRQFVCILQISRPLFFIIYLWFLFLLFLQTHVYFANIFVFCCFWAFNSFSIKTHIYINPNNPVPRPTYHPLKLGLIALLFHPIISSAPSKLFINTDNFRQHIPENPQLTSTIRNHQLFPNFSTFHGLWTVVYWLSHTPPAMQ